MKWFPTTSTSINLKSFMKLQGHIIELPLILPGKKKYFKKIWGATFQACLHENDTL